MKKDKKELLITITIVTVLVFLIGFSTYVYAAIGDLTRYLPKSKGSASTERDPNDFTDRNPLEEAEPDDADEGEYKPAAKYDDAGGEITLGELLRIGNEGFGPGADRDFAEYWFEARLNLYSNVFCIKHMKGLPSIPYRPVQYIPEGTLFIAANQIEPKPGKATSVNPSWKNTDSINGYYSMTDRDHADIDQFTTASNFSLVPISEGFDLKDTSKPANNYYGGDIFNTNVVTYAGTFSDKPSNCDHYGNYDAQHAIWGVVGISDNVKYDMGRYGTTMRAGNRFLAGRAVDAFLDEGQLYGDGVQNHNKGDEGKAYVIDDENPGTVLKDDDTYRVGPFHMNDYAYIYSEYVEEFSGSKISETLTYNFGDKNFGKPDYPRLVGGISFGAIKLTDDDGNSTYLEISKPTAKKAATEGEGKYATIVYEDFYGGATEIGDTTRGDGLEGCSILPDDYAVYPYPNSTFYIDIPFEAAEGFTTLHSLVFEYRQTTTEGVGSSFMVLGVQTEWNRNPGGAGDPNVLCELHYEKVHCGTCSDICHEDDHYVSTKDGGYTCHHDKPAHGPEFYCARHHHNDCEKSLWKGTTVATLRGQPGLVIDSAHVQVDEKKCTSRVKIRLTTDVTIKKFVYAVEHESNEFATFGNNVNTTANLYNKDDPDSARHYFYPNDPRITTQKPYSREILKDAGRKADPVYVEYGDIIYFRIDIINKQKYTVQFKLKDILPGYVGADDKTVEEPGESIDELKRSGACTWKDYQWISVLPKKVTTLYLTLRTNANDGIKYTGTGEIEGELYINTIKIVTRNQPLEKDDDENVDFMRTTDTRFGPVVNLAEKRSKDKEQSNIESREYYRINDYNLVVDKYVSKYNHEMMDENNANVQSKESYELQDRSVEGDLRRNYGEKYQEDPDKTAKLNALDKSTYEELKKNYPVPVERYETLIYTLKFMNKSEKMVPEASDNSGTPEGESDGDNDDELMGIVYETDLIDTDADEELSEEEIEKINGINKVATEVRVEKILDKLNPGLEFIKSGENYEVIGKIYDKDGNVQIELTQGTDFVVTPAEGEENSIFIELSNVKGKPKGNNVTEPDTYLVIQPGGYMTYEIKVKVVESNMSLDLLENTVEIKTLSNINQGVSRDGKTILCTECQGAGTTYKYEDCIKCNGTGRAEKEQKVTEPHTEICSYCKGTGCADGNEITYPDTPTEVVLPTKTIYKCKKCNTVYNTKPASCTTIQLMRMCGGTSFTNICTECGNPIGSAACQSHYKAACIRNISHNIGGASVGSSCTAPCGRALQPNYGALMNTTYYCPEHGGSYRSPGYCTVRCGYYINWYCQKCNSFSSSRTCNHYTITCNTCGATYGTEPPGNGVCSFLSVGTVECGNTTFFNHCTKCGKKEFPNNCIASMRCDKCGEYYGSENASKNGIHCTKACGGSFNEPIYSAASRNDFYNYSGANGEFYYYNYSDKYYYFYYYDTYYEYYDSYKIAPDEWGCSDCNNSKSNTTGSVYPPSGTCDKTCYDRQTGIVRYYCEECEAYSSTKGGACTHHMYICTECGGKYNTAGQPSRCTYKTKGPCGCTEFYEQEAFYDESAYDSTIITSETVDENGNTITSESEVIQGTPERDCPICGGKGFVPKTIELTEAEKEANRNYEATGQGTHYVIKADGYKYKICEVNCQDCGGKGKKYEAVTKECEKCKNSGSSAGSVADDETSDRIIRNDSEGEEALNRNVAHYIDKYHLGDYDGDEDNEKSTDYVRMKDLIISGLVWLDMDRDGYMTSNDNTLINHMSQDGYNLRDYYDIVENESTKMGVVVKLYISDDAGKTELVRTTRTDYRGIYVFGRDDSNEWIPDEESNWITDYKTSCWEDIPGDIYNKYTSAGANKLPYQRVDKATGKDKYGNYTKDSKYIKYFVEFEYDGVIFRSTEFYSGSDNIVRSEGEDFGKYDRDEKYTVTNYGSIKSDLGEEVELVASSTLVPPIKIDDGIPNNTETRIETDMNKGTPIEENTGNPKDFKFKYERDSNAAEFEDIRTTFNTKHQYISYNVAYDMKLNKTDDLKFDKTKHTSQLMEEDNNKDSNKSRLITARSFIKNSTIANADGYGLIPSDYFADKNKNWEDVTADKSTEIGNTDLLWLCKKTEPGHDHQPETEYLKHINLGLELREDVDITLTKDVYKVKTTINGEEMEYDFNKNNPIQEPEEGEGSNSEKTGLNGDILRDENTKVDYLRDYIVDKPYGIEIYEQDYKMRYEQYPAKTVREYKGVNGESELNIEVTYRITINNKKVYDDDLLVKGHEETNLEGKLDKGDVKDTQLDVRVHEVLDLYDQNFVRFTSEGDYIEVRQKDPETGLYKGAGSGIINKKIKVAEAWYFKDANKLTNLDKQMIQFAIASDPNIEGGSSSGGTLSDVPYYLKYRIDTTVSGENSKPIYIPFESQKELEEYEKTGNSIYAKIGLFLSTESQKYKVISEGNNEGDLDLSLGKPSEGDPFSVRESGFAARFNVADTSEETVDGYHRLYITGMGNEVIHEGEDLDIYVKYVLDKDALQVKQTNENYSETTTTSDTNTINGTVNSELFDLWYKVTQNSVITNSDDGYTLERSLKLAETAKKYVVNGEISDRGTENIAQVNAYSVWYANTHKPASIVDMDSNAGNIGLKKTGDSDTASTSSTTTGGSTTANSNGGSRKPEFNKTLTVEEIPLDNFAFYEDTTYKTGVEIVGESTENTKSDLTKYEGKTIIEIGGPGIKSGRIERTISGKIWDDTRSATVTEEESEGGLAATQYVGNGINSETDERNTEGLGARANELIPLQYTGGSYDENKDFPIRGVRAEFIEIVETEPGKYYEQVLKNVTWQQVQHNRSEADGSYELNGFIPGKYIVRFTYGDTLRPEVEEKVFAAPDIAPGIKYSDAIQQDMLIFNGQDYKSTTYTTAYANSTGTVSINNGVVNRSTILKDDEKDENLILKALENPNLSDARDDETKRLLTNAYSEVMNNSIAEILKGLANATELAPASEQLSDDQLQELTDNTYMTSDTVEFLVKPEKLISDSDEEGKSQESVYYKRKILFDKVLTGTEIQEVVDKNLNDLEVYYKELETIRREDIDTRSFKIENIDLGLQYRPENQILLSKEISEIKLIPSDGVPIMDLKFYTTGRFDDDASKLKHHIDEENSIGFNLVQFESNRYNNKLVNSLKTEKDQYFAFLQVDEDILQGCTLEVTYKFIAENVSEIDRISPKLNSIRYKNNQATIAKLNEVVNRILSRRLDLPIINKATTFDITDFLKTNGEKQNISIKELTNRIQYLKNEWGVVAGNIIDNYVSSALAGADVYSELYSRDVAENGYDGYLYRTSKKVMTDYYGQYTGNTYYTGVITNENQEKDALATLKFDEIIDYVDTDLEYREDATKEYNQNWNLINATNSESVGSALEADESDFEETYMNLKLRALRPYLGYVSGTGTMIGTTSGIEVGEIDLTTEDLNEIDKSHNKLKAMIKALTNKENIQYRPVVSVSDRTIELKVDKDPNSNEFREKLGEDTVNDDLSRFLLPKVCDDGATRIRDTRTGEIVQNAPSDAVALIDNNDKIKTSTKAEYHKELTDDLKNKDKNEEKDYNDYYYKSTGIVYLPLSKVFSAEEDTDDMTFENYAEITQFTTLTGRRTNFATTIGNVDIHLPDDIRSKGEFGRIYNDTYGSEEFKIASMESDTSSAERITLTPPTGLTARDRKIRDFVDKAKISTQYVVIIVAVAFIGVFGTRFTIKKIKKRRIK